MGSFLMACAVTGATLDEGSEVVAFKMQREEQSGRGENFMFNNEWFISDFPYHGIYNDYGNVLLPDDSEINSTDDNLMIMYKWAWETLVSIVRKDESEEDARYEEYNRQGLGYTNYRLKRIQEDKEEIDNRIKNKGLPSIVELMEMIKTTVDQEEKSKLLLLATDVLANSSSNYDSMRWGGEGCYTSDRFWKNKILSSDDPHKTHDRFREEVLVISKSTNFIYFRLYPSMYASQESNAREMVAFYEKGLEYFREVTKRWEAED